MRTALRTVECDGESIVYRREIKPVKNLNLRVRRDGSVYLSANRLVSDAAADRFVAGRAAFIRAAQARLAALAASRPPCPAWVDGDAVRLLGTTLHLAVEEAETDSATLDGGLLRLRLRGADDVLRRAALLERFYRGEAERVFGEVMREVLPRFAPAVVEMPALRIRVMRSRWGSCTPGKGRITLNLRLMEAPRDCITYVVLHEFCHLLHPNHAPPFYALLSAVCPDWQARRQTLREYAQTWALCDEPKQHNTTH